MPTKHPIKQRAGLWRVWYTIEINGNKKRRYKSFSLYGELPLAYCIAFHLEPYFVNFYN